MSSDSPPEETEILFVLCLDNDGAEVPIHICCRIKTDLVERPRVDGVNLDKTSSDSDPGLPSDGYAVTQRVTRITR